MALAEIMSLTSITAMIDEYLDKKNKTVQDLRSDKEFLISVNNAHPLASFAVFFEVDAHYFGAAGGYRRTAFDFPLEGKIVMIPVKNPCGNCTRNDSGQYFSPCCVKEAFLFTMDI